MTMTSSPDTDAILMRELGAIRKDIAQHAETDAAAIAGIHTRLDAIATEQARLATAVSDAAKTAERAREQANRVETAHDADVAARAGKGDVLQERLVRAQLDSIPEQQKIDLAIQKAKADAEIAIQKAKAEADAATAKLEAQSRARLRVQAAKAFAVLLTIIAAALGGAKWHQEVSTPAPVGVPAK